MFKTVKKSFIISPGRSSGAVLLLIMSVLALPLSFGLVVGKAFPFWDDVPLIGLPEMALAAMALIILFPERLLNAYRTRRSVRISGWICAAATLAVLFQQFYYHGTWEFFLTGMFYPLMPLAGIALSRELKRILPFFCWLLAPILLWSSFLTPHFTGFPGNWNWNLTMLAITLPSWLLWTGKRWYWWALAQITIGLTVFSLFFIELLPRGTIAGVVGAVMLLTFGFIFPPNLRWLYTLLLGAAGIVIFLAVVLSPATKNILDSRVQLWRGSLDFALAHCVAGVGPGRFENRIPPYLPPEYFFTPYVANLHPHSHNEFLNYWSGFGVAGILLLGVLFALPVAWIRHRDRYGLYLGYLMLVLIIHGQFDILLSMPLGGTLFLLSAGSLMGSGIAIKHFSSGFTARIFVALALTITVIANADANFRSGEAFRQAKLAQRRNDKQTARREFAKSRNIKATAKALYYAGRTELFRFHNPAGAIRLLSRLEDDLGVVNYLHNCGLLARAYAASGDREKALEYFVRETQNFPFSIINAKYHLDVLEQNNEFPYETAAVRNRLSWLIKQRGATKKTLPALLHNSDLDDAPLVPPILKP